VGASYAPHLAAPTCDAMLAVGVITYSEAPVDAPSRVFKLIQLSGDWY
jgi:hypothetical protein